MSSFGASGKPSLFQRIGGEDGLRRTVDAFYDIVETDPAGAPVHRLHLTGFGVSHLRQAQFEFLCGFLGGPRYYVERMGHSDVRRMHAHLAIGQAEVDAWLVCMSKAMQRAGVEEDLQATLMSHFSHVAQSLRNTTPR